MRHLGDITKINGAEIEAVDCITAGSPCQDLSIAGLRKGMQHTDKGDGETTRSGLFMEQIRIIKEMREHDRQSGRADDLIRPRYMVWENVPGAFSSNRGEDFRCVLEETARVIEEDAVIPRPAKGKWSASGCIVGDKWSIAWRVHDGQFWGTSMWDDKGNPLWLGTPQRRKRIALVADFGGHTAPEILFVRKSVFGDSDESKAEREDAAETTRGCSDSTSGVRILNPGDSQGNLVADSDGIFPTLRGCGGAGYQAGYCFTDREKSYGTHSNGEQPILLDGKEQISNCYGFEPGVAQRLNPENRFYEETAPSLRANPGDNRTSVVYDARGNGNGKISPTITGDHQNRITDYTAVVLGEDKGCSWDGGQISPTLTANNANGAQRMPDKDNFNAVITPPIECLEVGWMSALEEKSSALLARQYKDPPIINDKVKRSVVRRLTPMECERLQGFPDHWTDIGEWLDSKGKKHKDADTPRYKALGNSICLPFWFCLLRRISAQYERPATLGSLFDGIGGFPLCWVRCNGIGTARWASEIEEFPIAVTRKHFGDEDLGIEGDIRKFI